MAKDSLTFLEFLQTFRRGELLGEAESLLSEVVGAIKETGTKGKLTLTLAFEVNKAGQLECEPVLKIDKPRRPVGMGIYYVDDDNRLTRRDPGQLDMLDELAPRRSARSAAVLDD